MLVARELVLAARCPRHHVAVRVAHHDQQGAAETTRGHLDARERIVRQGVGADAHDVEFAEADVEDVLGSDPRVGAREHDGQRLLAVRQRLAATCREVGRGPAVAEETTVTTLEQSKGHVWRHRRRDGPGRDLLFGLRWGR
jgi:hypothetical protein